MNLINKFLNLANSLYRKETQVRRIFTYNEIVELFSQITNLFTQEELAYSTFLKHIYYYCQVFLSRNFFFEDNETKHHCIFFLLLKRSMLLSRLNFLLIIYFRDVIKCKKK